MEDIIYDKQGELQDSHWWFKGRREIVRGLLKKAIKKKGLVLDIGSGSGGMVDALWHFGRVEAVEMNRKLHPALKEAGVESIYICDITIKTPPKKYDVVTMFDALEHISDDSTILRVISDNLMKKNGNLIITVPAYQWLWTVHDDLSHHKRRYTCGDLEAKLTKAGFMIERKTYFMTILFLVAVLSRLVMKITRSKKTDLAMPSPFINRLMYGIFELESHIIPGLSLPFGLSVLVIARKI
jgi:2-polyprenyl-3-methyl-5-hydroxy-6-metoxy-1,4-benzoquinol methylase